MLPEQMLCLSDVERRREALFSYAKIPSEDFRCGGLLALLASLRTMTSLGTMPARNPTPLKSASLRSFHSFKIQKNIPLAEYTTFRLGGPAGYFVAAKTNQDIIKAVKFAKIKKLPYFILGGGSNLLVSDKGFNGIVIKTQNTRYQIQDTKIITEAGVKLGDLVQTSIKTGLTGLEWAVGIPGTVGGAIRVKASAFGHSISEIVREVEVLDGEGRTSRKFAGGSTSHFGCNEIILSAALWLKKDRQEKIRELIKNYLKYRKETQPLTYPSAGCIFKNPKLGSAPISAGYLIDQSGLKGEKIGRAMILEKHANFIVNLGGAKAKDVVKLIQLVKKTVKKKFGLELKEEIEYLGFDL